MTDPNARIGAYADATGTELPDGTDTFQHLQKPDLHPGGDPLSVFVKARIIDAETEPRHAVDDLAAWLIQIWDEDEALAKAADVKQGDPSWVTNHIALAYPRAFRVRSELDKRPIATVEDVAGDDDADTTGILDGQAAAAHIARHDPASALARIAADRQILKRCTDYRDGFGGDEFGGYWLAEAIVKDLALPHADRPGYQEAWRPA